MNADFNPRGGLTVDRDSLHASPGYARQVEAAKQLRERGVNADVEKAVERADAARVNVEVNNTHGERKVTFSADDYDTIRQHMRDQEAENAELRKIKEERWAVVATRNAAVMRTEKADALLRKCRDEFNAMPKSLAYDLTLMREITAHLGAKHE